MSKNTTLKNFTDKELNKELNRRRQKRRGKILGYRAILYGNEYEYGQYQNYLIKEMTAEQAEKSAKKSVKESKNGGCVEVLYKDNLKIKHTIH